MIKYKTKKVILEILNASMFMDFEYNRRTRPYKRTTKPLTDDDIYIIKGYIFVNMTPTKSIYEYSGIDVYEYPLNEYCECYTSLWNFHNKPFKEYINNDVDFSGKYPTEKNPPKIIFKPKQAKGGK